MDFLKGLNIRCFLIGGVSMKKITLSFLVFCMFLVSCSSELNIEESSVNYEFLNEEKSKGMAEKKLNLGDNSVIYMTVFPVSRIDNSYVIELDESGMITSYCGDQTIFADEASSNIGMVCKDIRKVLDYKEKSSRSLSKSEIKEIEKYFENIDFKYLNENIKQYQRDEVWDAWEYSLWSDEGGFFWYDTKKELSGMYKFIKKVIKMSPIRVKLESNV